MSVPDTIVYVDTSALVKLIVDEPETDAVLAELQQRDVIHLATAASLGDEFAGLLTYDIRMQEAATALGVTVIAPH